MGADLGELNTLAVADGRTLVSKLNPTGACPVETELKLVEGAPKRAADELLFTGTVEAGKADVKAVVVAGKQLVVNVKVVGIRRKSGNERVDAADPRLVEKNVSGANDVAVGNPKNLVGLCFAENKLRRVGSVAIGTDE